MRKNFKEKSVTLLVGIVMFGATYSIGQNVVWSGFWTALISTLFYSLWSLADLINDYELWQTSVDSRLDTLVKFEKTASEKLTRLDERSARFKVDENQIHQSENKNNSFSPVKIETDSIRKGL